MQVGEEFILGEDVDLEQYESYYRTHHFRAGTTMRITRIYTNRAIVRGHTNAGRQASAYIDIETLAQMVDPSLPRSRKLGEVPEGGISPNDPGLKWLWEDAAKLAKDEGYCGVYDTLCAKLGIPGRPKNYSASIRVGNVLMIGKFLCHSKEEALELFKTELEDQGLLVPGGAAMEVLES
jgi:hypothetical protein